MHEQNQLSTNYFTDLLETGSLSPDQINWAIDQLIQREPTNKSIELLVENGALMAALKILTEPVEKQKPWALFAYGKILFEEKPSPRSVEDAIAYLSQACASGNKDAVRYMADHEIPYHGATQTPLTKAEAYTYIAGYGTPEDHVKAAKCYLQIGAIEQAQTSIKNAFDSEDSDAINALNALMEETIQIITKNPLEEKTIISAQALHAMAELLDPTKFVELAKFHETRRDTESAFDALSMARYFRSDATLTALRDYLNELRNRVTDIEAIAQRKEAYGISRESFNPKASNYDILTRLIREIRPMLDPSNRMFDRSNEAEEAQDATPSS